MSNFIGLRFYNYFCALRILRLVVGIHPRLSKLRSSQISMWPSGLRRHSELRKPLPAGFDSRRRHFFQTGSTAGVLAKPCKARRLDELFRPAQKPAWPTGLRRWDLVLITENGRFEPRWRHFSQTLEVALKVEKIAASGIRTRYVWVRPTQTRFLTIRP